MIIGSDEWIKKLSNDASRGAEDEITAIAIRAARNHNASGLTLSEPDKARVSLILHEVQHECFSLGVRTGVDMMIKLIQQTGGVTQ